jgi:hypothetical protein
MHPMSESSKDINWVPQLETAYIIKQQGEVST